MASGEVAEPRRFDVGSLAAIDAEHRGRPFILSVWSTECAHCPAELHALSDLKKKYPQLDLVLVAADSTEAAPLALGVVKRQGLDRVEQWIFADTAQERLRYAIDPTWMGELPRTYFYDRDHRRVAVSGTVSPQRLAQWASRQWR